MCNNLFPFLSDLLGPAGCRRLSENQDHHIIRVTNDERFLTLLHALSRTTATEIDEVKKVVIATYPAQDNVSSEIKRVLYTKLVRRMYLQMHTLGGVFSRSPLFKAKFAGGTVTKAIGGVCITSTSRLVSLATDL